MVESLKDILEFADKAASVSMYMFHGGTNFGYTQVYILDLSKHAWVGSSKERCSPVQTCH